MTLTASKFYAAENLKKLTSTVCWAKRVVLLIHCWPRHGILNA